MKTIMKKTQTFCARIVACFIGIDDEETEGLDIVLHDERGYNL